MRKLALATVCLATMVLATGCKVVVTGSSTYETCFDSSDCNNAFDSCVSITNGSVSDRMCTQDCVFDTDCPGSGFCVSFDGIDSFCYQSCLTSSICEPGWSCNTVTDGVDAFNICLPGGSSGPPPPPPGIPPYDLCDVRDVGTVGDCSTESDGCAGITVGGIVMAGLCTSNCGAGLPACPVDSMGEPGICLSFDGMAPLCFERCVTNADCPDPFVCKPAAPGEQPICLPPG